MTLAIKPSASVMALYTAFDRNICHGSVAQLAERFVNSNCTEKVLGSSPGGIILFFFEFCHQCIILFFINFSFILFIQFFKRGLLFFTSTLHFFFISICLFNFSPFISYLVYF